MCGVFYFDCTVNAGKRCTFYAVEPAEGAGTLPIPLSDVPASSHVTINEPVAHAQTVPALNQTQLPRGHPPAAGGKCPFSVASSLVGNGEQSNPINWILPVGLVVVAVGLSYFAGEL